MIVTFLGHGDSLWNKDLVDWLYETVEQTIKDGATLFYHGGYGSFDNLARQTVWKLKDKYPHIESVLVIPYLDKKIDFEDIDGTVYPPLETVPKRFAISKRNEWMINESNLIISGVTHSFGGAAKSLEYALRKKKQIINYPNNF